MRFFLPLNFGPLAMLSILASLSPLSAADAPVQLEDFRNKVADVEARQDQKNAHLQNRQAAAQLGMLKRLIEREDYQRAQQMLESFGSFGLPPELQEEWATLSDEIAKDLERRKLASLEKWSAEVSQLVADAKKACLEAKTSAELDPLLIRSSGMQMRLPRIEGAMGERLNRKLQGVNYTLTQWADYLDFCEAGDAKAANDRLRSLAGNNSSFPVLSAAEIEERYLPVTDPSDGQAFFAAVFKDVKSPDDLPGAIKRLESLAAKGQNSGLGSFRQETTRLNRYLAAWNAAKNGNLAEVSSLLTSGGYEIAEPYLSPLRRQIEAEALKSKVSSWTNLTQEPEEDPSAFLGRILDDLKTKGDYAKMAEVLEFAGQLNRTAPQRFYGERQCILQYLAGKRLEAAGDEIAAITNYRLAVASPAGKYTPTAEAEAALKRLLAAHPEATSDTNTALSEQIRSLSEQIRMLLNRPYRP